MRKNTIGFFCCLVMLAALLVLPALATGGEEIPGGMVARIGDTYYATLQEAIDAAEAGQTVTLLTDITVAAEDDKPETQVWVKEGKDVIVDLNGNTVTGAFFINGTAKLQNGTITNDNFVSGIESKGKLTLENMTVTSNRHGVRISGGSATIISGTYQTVGSAGSTTHTVNVSNASVTIKGGTFIGAGEANNGGSGNCLMLQGGTTASVEGGIFYGSNGVEGTICPVETLTITGGSFAIWNYNAYLPDTLHAVLEGEYYTVGAHVAVTDQAVDPDCTNTGLTEGSHCEICKKVFVAQTVLDALGHTEETIPAVAPSYSSVGYTEGIKCSVCQETLTAPEEIPATVAITWAGKTLLYESIIQIKYIFTAHPENAAASDFGLEVWYSQVDFATVSPERIYTSFEKNGAYWQVVTDGIAAKNMADKQYVRAYILIEGVKYYTEVLEYSPAIYAESRYENTTNPATKALVIALMNYGTAAQNYFGYKTDAPMNAFLQEGEKTYSFSNELFAPLGEVDPQKVTTDTDFFVTVQKNLQFEGTVNTMLRTELSVDRERIDLANSKLLYWSPADYAGNESLHINNATKKADLIANGPYLVGVFGDVAAKDLGETGYYCFYIVDENGEGHYSELIAYSAHKYAENKLTSTNPQMVELAKTMVIYSSKVTAALNSPEE